MAIGAAIPAPMTTFWSLAVEEQFYLIWPVVVYNITQKSLFRIALAGVFIAPMLRLAASPWFSTSGAIFLLTPFRADLLLAGAVLAFFWKDRREALLNLGWWPLWVMAASGALFQVLSICIPILSTR